MQDNQPTTVSPTCGSCKHFKSDPRNLQMGHCRRFPPVAMPLPNPRGGIMSWGDFAPVNREQSCGEYAVKVGIAL